MGKATTTTSEWRARVQVHWTKKQMIASFTWLSAAVPPENKLYNYTYKGPYPMDPTRAHEAGICPAQGIAQIKIRLGHQLH